MRFNPMRIGGNQERYLLAERSSDASFFIVVWYEVRGPLDTGRLSSAIRAAINQHPALRTGFKPDLDNVFRCEVHDKPKFTVEFSDITEASSAEIQRVSAPFIGKVSNIADPAALQHYAVLRITDSHHVLVFSHHHSISDGKSLDHFVVCVAAAYNGEPFASASPTVPYQVSEPSRAAATEYFRAQLADLDGAPRLHRNISGERRMQAQDLSLETAQTDRLHSVASNSSVFSVLAAVFAMQISGMTGSDDVVFSIQSAGRRADTPAIGSFSNALPLRVRLDPNETFDHLSKRLKVLIREAVSHEQIPYHVIQQQTGVRPDFALNLYPSAPPIEMKHLTIGPRNFLPSDSDYAINLRWQRRGTGEDATYHGQTYFNGGEIEEACIESFNRRFETLLAAAINDPAQRIDQLLSIGRRAPIPRTGSKLPARRLIDLVDTAIAEHGERSAIEAAGTFLSYAQLSDAIESEVSRLASMGIRAGETVAFLASRSVGFVVTMLALSRIGAIFAVLDAEYPDARLIELAQTLSPDHVVAAAGGDDHRLSIFETAGLHVPTPGMASMPAHRVAQPPTDREVAYFLFTSGTTGKPRAVGVGHSALPAFIAWQRETFAISTHDRVSLLSGLAHDPVMRDIFLPLSSGATLCIPDVAMLQSAALVDWVRRTGVTVLHTTPPMGTMIAAFTGNPTFPALRYIFWGGDRLPQALVNRFYDANDGLRQINFYGSTETPQAAAFHLIERELREGKIVPIGRAAAECSVHVTDKGGRELAAWEVGEITIQTPYFVHLVDREASPQVDQYYKTGDLGYRTVGGDIQLIGRADHQVKIRGYRVELGDVEDHLRAVAGVQNAIAMVRAGPDGSAALVGHVVVDPAADASEKSILSAMGRMVPPYMVPAQVVLHSKFPLLPNGKTDLASLRNAHERQSANELQLAKTSAAFTSRERAIATVYANVTGRAATSPSICFADLGADSLNSIQAMLRLETIIGDLPEDWYDQPIAELAKLDQRVEHTGIASLVGNLIRPTGLDPAIPMRAILIAMIVALHFDVWKSSGGQTFGLIFLAGMAFSRFQWSTVINGSIAPLLNGLLKVAIVSFPIGVIYSAKLYVDHNPEWYKPLIFAANFIDYYERPAARVAVWLWFVSCFIQMYAIIAFAAQNRKFRRALKHNSFQTITLIFLILAALRFLLPLTYRQNGLSEIVPMEVWTYLPTTHLATFVLGVLIQQARPNESQLTFALALGLTYAALTDYYFPQSDFIITGTVIAVAACIRGIPVPLILARILGYASQASLLIYLLHMPAYTALKKLGIENGVFTLAAVLILTTAFAIQFDKGYAWVRDRILASRGTRNVTGALQDQTM